MTKLNWAKSITCVVPFTIGERGALRVLLPDDFHGPAQPIANVGDTIIVPVYVPHHPPLFARIDPKTSAYLANAKEPYRHEVLLKRANDKGEG